MKNSTWITALTIALFANQSFAIDLKTYWPQPIPGQNLIQNFVYVDSSGVKYPAKYSRYRNSNGNFLLEEFDPNLNWIDTWDYRVTASGVQEYGDQLGAYYTAQGYAPDVQMTKPIYWGNNLNVGQSDGAPIEVNAAAQNRALQTWDFGWQTITLLSFTPSYKLFSHNFNNVVALQDQQSFCANSNCSAKNTAIAIYYMAPGLGFIQVDYDYQNWTYKGTHYLNQYCYGPDTQFSCP